MSAAGRRQYADEDDERNAERDKGECCCNHHRAGRPICTMCWFGEHHNCSDKNLNMKETAS